MRRFILLPTISLLFILSSSHCVAIDVVSSITPVLSSIPLPSPTVQVTVTPTPTIVLENKEPNVFTEELDEVTAGEVFTIPLNFENFPPSSSYSLKLLVQDGDSVINKTIHTETDDDIAWNGAWEKFPVISVKDGGMETFNYETKITDSSKECECTLVLRIRSENNKNQDFELGVLSVIPNEYIEEETQLEVPNAIDDEKIEPTPLLIVDVKSQKKETMVEVEGVITSSLNELAKNTLYIEDETGGIKIVVKQDSADLTRGVSIKVSGTVQEAFNEMYIKVDSSNAIEKLGNGDLPDPLTVPTGKVDESVEGKTVFINGEVTATSGNTFFINDGSGDAKVYIKESTGIDKPKMRTGYFSAVTGVVSQYKDDYRVLPRFQEDVIVSVVPIDPSVLGSIAMLPETAIRETWREYFAVILIILGSAIRFVLVFLSLLFTRRNLAK